MEFNVFCKAIKNSKGKEFKVYFTKNENGVTFAVKFREDCDGREKLPKDTTPFVLVAEPKFISQAIKRVKTEDKEYIKPTLYIRKITDIKEYEEPEFDAKSFNNVDDSVFNSGELPF